MKEPRRLPVEEALTVADVQRALGYRSRRSVYNVEWLWRPGNVFYVNNCPRWLPSTLRRYRLEHEQRGPAKQRQIGSANRRTTEG